MKKWTVVLICLLLTLVCAAAAAEVKINEKTFPDGQFRAFVEENCDSNRDGKLSDAEIAAVKEILCYSRHIQSLKGIEIFTELKTLSCAANRLTELDVSKNTKLTSLTCGGNMLTSLDLSRNTDLRSLAMEANKIETIDLSKLKKLTSVSCENNPMETLDVSGNPVLAAMVRKGGPKKYDEAFYGWWDGPKGYWPSKHLFISEEMKVITVNENVTLSGLNYKLNEAKKTAALTGAANAKSKTLTIPDTVKVEGMTFRVTQIAANAFKGMETLARVTIGKNVTTIGKNAFVGCANLKSIIIQTAELTVKKVGGNAFMTGCTKTTVKCPKDKLEDYKKILLKKGLGEDTKFTK